MMDEKQKAKLVLSLFFALLLAGYLYLAARGIIDWEWWKEVLLGAAAVFAVRMILSKKSNMQ